MLTIISAMHTLDQAVVLFGCLMYTVMELRNLYQAVVMDVGDILIFVTMEMI